MKTFISFFIILHFIPLGMEGRIISKEFEISLEKDVLEAQRESIHTLKINIQRYQGYLKSKAKMGISSTLPPGVSIQFDPVEGFIDKTNASISIGGQAAPGTYSIILNSTLNNKTKGVILKLIIV